MYRVISINLNGIRSAARKGVFEWLPQQNADVVCLQETRAQVSQLEDEQFWPEGYHCQYVDAQKKGYSGVAIYSKEKPKKIITEFDGDEFDNEGRYIEYQFDKLSVVSVYFPSGSSGEERQAAKFRFLDLFLPYLERNKRKRRDYIICGDWNIAHKNIDLKNWRGNKKNSGFLPEERAWLDQVFDECGYNDAFREVCQDEHQYTWWSNRGQAWANNTGWRIDYHVTSPRLKGKAIAASIYKEERFSDHAPLIVDYDL